MTIHHLAQRLVLGLLTFACSAFTSAQLAPTTGAPTQPLARVSATAVVPGVAVPVPGQQITNLCALQPVGGGPADIVIPDNGVVYEISGNVNCGLITVKGTLRCADGVNAVVKMDGMMITGPNARLECGTAGNRFSGNVTFTLRNDRAFPAHPGHGERAFVVMNGGTLELHGLIRKARFSRLNADAAAGATSLVTPGLVGWEADDQIILTTTNTYPDQTELLTLADDCPGGICSITSSLDHFHYGSAPRVYPGAGENGLDLSVDMRAYLANVERNITIRGANDVHWNSPDPKGGHLMIMGGATAHIDAVEFNRMGQQKILGRYPVHWHHAGNVEGQYLRNSSIRNSPSRCVALHNTHRVDVRNNLCYNVAGHAMFMENGNEIENTLVGNLVVDVVEPPSTANLLQTDIDIQLSRWRGPAGFWITNGNNTIQDNVVVNAGTGYWHAYIHKIQCYDDPTDKTGTLNPTYGRFCDYVPRSASNPADWNVEPVKSLTLLYKDNVAVATRIGHTWDGAPDGPLVDPQHISPPNPFDRYTAVTGYAPGSPQRFDGMHAYKQGRTGVYFRGAAKSARIINSVVAEAPTGWFGTGNQEYFDSVFVGISDNFQGIDPADEDFYYHIDTTIPGVDRGGQSGLYKGWGLYDGANHFRHVTFDYPVAPMYLNGREMTPTPITRFGRAHFANHLMEDIQFVNDPYRRIFYGTDTVGINWKDVLASESNYDIDGSLFGAPGFLRPDIPFNDLASDCVREANNADADPTTPPSTILRCQTPTQSVKIQMAAQTGQADFQTFDVIRLDTMATVGNSDPQALFTKFQAYADTPQVVNYRIDNLDFRATSTLNLVWIETPEQGDWTPPIIIDGATAMNLASGCSLPSEYELENWPNFSAPPIYEAQSVAEIRTFNDPAFAGAYYQHTATGSLILRLQGTKFLAGAPYLADQHKAEGKFELVCP